MRVRFGAISALAVCASLAACDSKPKAPTGQVVATVDGSEVTLSELRSELTGVSTSDPKVYETAKQRALQVIVMRKILAKAARDQSLDKTPDFAVQRERANEVLLVQALQSKILGEVPVATPEEAATYITQHPNIFAQRKIFTFDQIATPPLGPDMEHQLKPLNNLGEVEAVLNKAHIPFRRGASGLDAVGADPNFVDTLSSMDPHELIIMPSPRGWTINQITDVKVQPFTGDAATKYAVTLMTQQRKQEALTRSLYSTMSQGRSKISYAAGYKPLPSAQAPGKPAASSKPAA
jgi:peptidyl-prolyl cis-trans isomerase C